MTITFEGFVLLVRRRPNLRTAVKGDPLGSLAASGCAGTLDPRAMKSGSSSSVQVKIIDALESRLINYIPIQPIRQPAAEEAHRDTINVDSTP